jgi:hypothetical protein
MDSLLNNLTLDGLDGQGDARAAWQAVAFCIEKGLPFPDWVTRYLAATAANLTDHLDSRDERHPTKLIEALGFDSLSTPERYDPYRDPETVYERIVTWLETGEVKNVSKGAERYHKDVLRGVGEVGTVRGLFYKGQERHPLARRTEKRT